MRILIGLALGCLIMTALNAYADESWRPATDRGGVAVWTRPVPDFPIHEFKAATTVHSTLAGLVALVMDTGNAPSWVFRTRYIELLHRDDEKGEFRIHVITEFPWPLRNRDVVLAGTVQQGADGIVTITSRSVAAPVDPDYVRMPYFSGIWTFRPVGKGDVEVTMRGLADPGGVIPNAIVNLIIYETPYQTLRGLRRVIGAPRYQSATVAQIREP